MPSINEVAQDNTWDLNDVTIAVDGLRLDLATTGDLFTCSFTNDNITISVDVWGNGLRIINHNAQANITINASRLSNLWKKLLKNNNEERTAEHTIEITTPVERITSTTASFTKIPDLSAGNDAPTVALQFSCIRANASAV